MLVARFKGLAEAKAAVQHWSPEAFVALVAPQASKSLLSWLRYFIAQRTGETAKTLGTEMAGTHILATGNLIAWFLYHGTKPHIIEARNKRALAFPGSSLGEDLIVRRLVHHPGTGGTNYPLAAWQAASPEIRLIAQRAAASLLRGGA